MTKVCSLHFKSTDLKKTLTGRINPLPDAVPSQFKWKESPKKRKHPKERIPLPPATTTTTQLAEVETTTDTIASISMDIDDIVEENSEMTVREELNAAMIHVKELELQLSKVQNDLRQPQMRVEMLENETQSLQEHMSL